MSGKIIMKRKLNQKPEHSSFSAKLEIEEQSAVKLATPTPALELAKPEEKSNEDLVKQPESKRIRCDRQDVDTSPSPQTSRQNRHLLEAIQSKMAELQNELAAFEHDVEAQEEGYFYENNDRYHSENSQMSEYEAEALGFAMCAQETMLFLEREGVSSSSILYTRLHDALVGRSPTDRI